MTNFIGLPRKIDSEDKVDTSGNLNKRQKNAVVRRVPSESLDLSGSPTPDVDLSTPAIAQMEIHKAAIRAAFQDKSANRTELLWTLLPYITLAEAEDIFIRCKGAAKIERE